MSDVHLEALHADGGFLGRLRGLGFGPIAAGAGRLGDELLAKESGRIGVVVDPEHQLARGRIYPCAPTDHLVEADGRLEILEEDDVPHAGHVHTSG